MVKKTINFNIVDSVDEFKKFKFGGMPEGTIEIYDDYISLFTKSKLVRMGFGLIGSAIEGKGKATLDIRNVDVDHFEKPKDYIWDLYLKNGKIVRILLSGFGAKNAAAAMDLFLSGMGPAAGEQAAREAARVEEAEEEWQEATILDPGMMRAEQGRQAGEQAATAETIGKRISDEFLKSRQAGEQAAAARAEQERIAREQAAAAEAQAEQERIAREQAAAEAARAEQERIPREQETAVPVFTADEIICPSCKERTPKGRFCMMCGSPLKKICPDCGTELPDRARFCFHCGCKVD